MRKLSQKEAIGVGVAIVVIIAVVVFGSFGLLPNSLSLNPFSNNTNNNMTDTNQVVQNTNAGQQLLVEDITIGTGTAVVAGNTITVNYKGTLLNGQIFDSSYPADNPGVKPERKPLEIQIGVGQVIPGWDQGILGMKVGGKRKLVIPAALAYGNQAVGPIPANSTLVFEVELLGLK